jgi:2-polyprenyl-3-methyl-5-hydroxy-6-metoxy-1,4-benzoquinol methylase
MLNEGYRVTAEHEAAHWWFRARRELFLRQVRRAAGQLGFPARRLRLLDYGCGTGFNLAFLSEFGEVTGADVPSPSPAPSHAAWQRAGGPPIVDLTGDLTRYAGRFHILTVLDVLEHLDDDLAGLRQMARLLVPGGQLVVTVPAYGWLWSGEDVISQHRRRYTRRTLLQRCHAAGLTVAWASYFNLAILPAMALVVGARRLLPAAGARSNLETGVGFLDPLAEAVATREARWVGDQRLRLPAGASLVCRLIAPAGAAP